jgi:hypothetical protein
VLRDLVHSELNRLLPLGDHLGEGFELHQSSSPASADYEGYEVDRQRMRLHG